MSARAAIYARISTVGNGQSPEMQLRELREYCDRRQWQIAGARQPGCNWLALTPCKAIPPKQKPRIKTSSHSGKTPTPTSPS